MKNNPTKIRLVLLKYWIGISECEVRASGPVEHQETDFWGKQKKQTWTFPILMLTSTI